MPHDAYQDPMKVEIEVTCSFCAKKVLLQAELCMALRVGDPLYTDPHRDNFGRCPSCKRKKMMVTKVPTQPSTESVIGFWKPPTGPVDSSEGETE